MSYYRVCPCCGAHLDPGEVCDCRENEKTPAVAGGGWEERADHDISASHDTTEWRKRQV